MSSKNPFYKKTILLIKPVIRLDSLDPQVLGSKRMALAIDLIYRGNFLGL